MNAHRKTPLAWYQMAREKIRLLLAIAGIAFANVLIFMQLGFLQSLYDGSTRPHRSLNADVVVVNPRQETFFCPRSFSRKRLHQVLKYPEVQDIATVRMSNLVWRNPVTNSTRTILVFGIEPSESTFILPGLKENIHYLKQFKRVLFDSHSRPEFGPIANLLNQYGTLNVELSGKRIKVVGSFNLGASFSADGNVITSDTTFNYLTGRKSTDEIQIGLIKLKPGVDVEVFKQQLQAEFKGDLSVYTKQQFAQLEENYWANSTGVGFIFGLGVFVGFVVGVVIVYQILHADVADHLAEYATLKAIGYKDSALTKILMEEACMLSVFGFVPGIVLSLAIYNLAESVTLMPVQMTVARAVMVFILTVIMCMISAIVASRKLRLADPAEIF